MAENLNQGGDAGSISSFSLYYTKPIPMTNSQIADLILQRLIEKGLLDDLREFVGRKHKSVLLGDFSDAIEETLDEVMPNRNVENTDADAEAQDWETFGEGKI